MTYENNYQPLRVLQQKSIERAMQLAYTADRNRIGENISLAQRYGKLADHNESKLTRMLKDHDKDEDCIVDPATDLCIGCGVYHGGDPCPACGQRAFHLNDCSTLGIEVPAEDDNIGGLPFGLTAPALLYMAIMLGITAWVINVGLHLHN